MKREIDHSHPLYTIELQKKCSTEESSRMQVTGIGKEFYEAGMAARGLMQFLGSW